MRTASSGAVQHSPVHRRACIVFALCLPPTQPGAFANPQVIGQLQAGVWASVGGLGTSTREYPLTELGRQRYESFRLDQDPSLQCIPPGMPRGFSPRSPMDFAFHGNTLTIRYETMDVIRTIAMDGDSLPPDAPHAPNGHSVGHWEGDSLVIDTTHLSAGEVNRNGIPKSERMTIRETYDVEERDGAMVVLIRMTLTDPENFTEPVIQAEMFEYRPDWELLPFECNVTEY